jgi:hypothetical protein
LQPKKCYDVQEFQSILPFQAVILASKEIWALVVLQMIIPGIWEAIHHCSNRLSNSFSNPSWTHQRFQEQILMLNSLSMNPNPSVREAG